MALAPGFFSSCKPVDTPKEKVAITATLSCGVCATASGTNDFHTWRVADRVSAMNMSTGAMSKPTAAVLPGSGESNFIIGIEEPAQNENILVWYPGDATPAAKSNSVEFDIPSVQDGKLVAPLYFAAGKPASRKMTLTLQPQFSVIYVQIPKGSFRSTGFTLSAQGGEDIAGKVVFSDLDKTASVKASEATISVTFAQAFDNSIEGLTVPVAVAPVHLSKGYKVVVSTTAGDVEISDSNPVTLKRGEGISTSGTSASVVPEIMFCGSNWVYLVDANLAREKGYHSAELWSLNVKNLCSTLGISGSTHHLDDCKIVDGGRKVLITCSNSGGYCLLVDMASRKADFYATGLTNAHSAELYDGRIYVACSDGNDKVHVYSASESDKVLNSYPLTSAHGVVAVGGMLYAIGGRSLNIYEIKGDELVLTKTVQTPKSGLHDLSLVDSNTLCVSGNCSYLYFIGTNTFAEISLLSGRTALKSVNYNSQTKELWYTDATTPEGGETWSTQTICYSNNPAGTGATHSFKVPDLAVYKCRVKNW